MRNKQDDFALGSLAQPTKRWVLILTTLTKKQITFVICFLVGRVVGLSWILLSLGQVICFTSLSQIFVLTYSSSLAIARLHSYVKFAEPPKGNPSPTQLHNKKDTDISQYLFYLSTGGLEPPQLSPHAPQACVSTIPPHRHGI